MPEGQGLSQAKAAQEAIPFVRLLEHQCPCLQAGASHVNKELLSPVMEISTRIQARGPPNFDGQLTVLFGGNTYLELTAVTLRGKWGRGHLSIGL